MLRPVPRDEGRPPPSDLTDCDRCRGRAVGRLYFDLFDAFEQGVEPGPTEHADRGGALGQPDVSLEALPLFVELSDEDEPEPDLAGSEVVPDSFFPLPELTAERLSVL